MKEGPHVLHILNGDATLEIFKSSGIVGDVAVMREMMVEGPLVEELSSSLFWQCRSQYFFDEYEISNEEYETRVLGEIEKIQDTISYDEVILWFEYDVFCQINMTCCLQMIDHKSVSLICVGDEDGTLKGLGEHPQARYGEFFANRVMLQSEETSYIRSVWESFRTGDDERLRRLSRFPPFIFRYLRPAMEAFLKLRPDTQTGLGSVEKEMLLAVARGISDERSLIRHMLKWQVWLGFGDLQYIRILKNNSGLFLRDPLRLSQAGNQLVKELQ